MNKVIDDMCKQLQAENTRLLKNKKSIRSKSGYAKVCKLLIVKVDVEQLQKDADEQGKTVDSVELLVLKVFI